MIVAARSWLVLFPRSQILALAGVACWVGVICAEFAEAQILRWYGKRSIQGVIEEGLEVVGTTLFLMSFLEFLHSIAAGQRGFVTEMPELDQIPASGSAADG
jgi:hypothetical protein